MKPEEIRTHLFEMQDVKYRDFQTGLIPGVNPDKVIGVRTPQLRVFAKELFKSGDYAQFLDLMPHDYYDEMNLHGFVICEMKDYDTVISYLDCFLPCVDNWATCDLLSPKKAFKKNIDRLILDIRRWMDAQDTYTIRFGIEMLMSWFLDDEFKPEYLKWVADISSDEYYINMMRAWYFATALAKQYDSALLYIEGHILDDWTHLKTIQKARESYRITDDQKNYLKSLK